MFKTLIFSALFAVTAYSGFSQNNTADSLNALLNVTEKPIERFDILNKMALNLVILKGDNIDSAASIQMIQIAEDLDNDSLRAISYNWLGSFFSLHKGDNALALEFFFKGVPLAEKIGDKRRISSLYFDMALVYFDIQDYELAIKMTRKGGENLPDTSHHLYDFMLLPDFRIKM